jgi:hypothetical protein
MTLAVAANTSPNDITMMGHIGSFVRRPVVVDYPQKADGENSPRETINKREESLSGCRSLVRSVCRARPTATAPCHEHLKLKLRRESLDIDKLQNWRSSLVAKY